MNTLTKSGIHRLFGSLIKRQRMAECQLKKFLLPTKLRKFHEPTIGLSANICYKNMFPGWQKKAQKTNHETRESSNKQETNTSEYIQETLVLNERLRDSIQNIQLEELKEKKAKGIYNSNNKLGRQHCDSIQSDFLRRPLPFHSPPQLSEKDDVSHLQFIL